MKLIYEIYNGVPYLTDADMSDTSNLNVSVTRGSAISVKFAGTEKRLCRNCATFNTEKLENGIHRISIFTDSGIHHLIPIKTTCGVAELYRSDDILCALYNAVLEERKRTDKLTELAERLSKAVFGNTIL